MTSWYLGRLSRVGYEMEASREMASRRWLSEDDRGCRPGLRQYENS